MDQTTLVRLSRRGCARLLWWLALGIAGALPASAQSVADFYRGKTITLVVGTASGNDYDFRARLLARFMGKYIPGEPTIVPRNMPGAGGIVAMNYLASVAPHDGTYLHMIMSPMTSLQAMHAKGVEYDARKFRWIGNMTDAPNVTNAWYTSGVTTFDQVRTRGLIVAAPRGTSGYIYAEAMNQLTGAKFKIVSGYPGGNEMNLAMERGEVEGRGSNSWASWKATHQDWIDSGKIRVLVQIGLKRAADLKDVPLLYELASNDADRDLLRFLSADIAISRSLVVTPDTPDDRVEALRTAFDKVMQDADFRAEAGKANMDISPTRGAEAQAIADSIVDTKPKTAERAKAILGLQ